MERVSGPALSAQSSPASAGYASLEDAFEGKPLPFDEIVAHINSSGAFGPQ
jgi:hypothetical protein